MWFALSTSRVRRFAFIFLKCKTDINVDASTECQTGRTKLKRYFTPKICICDISLRGQYPNWELSSVWTPRVQAYTRKINYSESVYMTTLRKLVCGLEGRLGNSAGSKDILLWGLLRVTKVDGLVTPCLLTVTRYISTFNFFQCRHIFRRICPE